MIVRAAGWLAYFPTWRWGVRMPKQKDGGRIVLSKSEMNQTYETVARS